ncbi:hypothetical protein WS71_24455 [Burkholderia mayonis]|uniref:Uncharacterized protein n=1 Tax=Burkholderia mayonis TaxID=1385591 RepID=A0A1B4G3A1_9BURK|nr:hypothetical protein WS71_24455 [Burkholderia mayonis]
MQHDRLQAVTTVEALLLLRRDFFARRAARLLKPQFVRRFPRAYTKDGGNVAAADEAKAIHFGHCRFSMYGRLGPV